MRSSGERVAASLPGCQTSAVAAYHEAYWVVAGTAAPVIALAVIVAVSDAAGARDLVDVAREFLEQSGVPDRRIRRAVVARNAGLLLVAVLAASVLAVQAFMLFIALVSIESVSNAQDPYDDAWLSLGSVLGLFLLTIVLGRIRYDAGVERSMLAGPAEGRRVRRPAQVPARPKGRPRWQSRPPVRRPRG
jgi:hypothetical protein